MAPFFIGANMAAEIFTDASRALDANANPYAGAKLYFYATGTTTPQSVYTTAALNVAHTNPVVADSGGQFPAIYFDASKQYRGILKNSTESVTMYDIDPINPGVLAELASPTGASSVKFTRPFTGARLQEVSEILNEQLITPDTFRQTGDTVLSRLQSFIDALGDGVYGRLDQDYEIPSQLEISSKSRFKIYGNGYTIKLKDGAATGYGGSALYFYQCTDFEVIDLICDGNRANRTPAEDPAHVIVVDKCHDWRFTRVQAINGTCDGFLIYAGSAGSGAGGIVTLDDCPSRWVMEDCIALNNYRQGATVAEGIYGHFLRGRYALTTGLWDTSNGPCAGIDCESDDQPTWDQNRIQHIDFTGVEFSENQGPGLLLSQQNGAKYFRIVDCKFIGNRKAAIESFASEVYITRPLIVGWDQVDYTARVGAPAKRGCIDIADATGPHSITSPTFCEVDNGADDTNPCIFTASTAANGIDISDIQTDGSASFIANLYSPYARIRDSHIDLSGAVRTDAILLQGADQRFEDNTLTGIYERALYAGGARARITGNDFHVRVWSNTRFVCDTADSTGPHIEGNRVRLSSSDTTLGIRAGADAWFVNNWTENLGGGAVSYSATPTFTRGNVANGTKLTETAIAP